MDQEKKDTGTTFSVINPFGNEQNAAEEIPSPPKEPIMDAAEERLSKLEKLLRDVHPSWQIAIYRVQPGWCKGYLETIEISEDGEPIDLDYLVRIWGGEKLRVRVKDQKNNYVGGCDIPLHSYEPKKWGKLLKAPFDESAPRESANALGSIESILSIVDRLKKNDLDPIVKLLLQQQQSAIQPAPNGMQQLLESINVIRSLKGLFGDSGESARPADSSDMFGQINSLLQTYAQIKGSADPKKATIVPPVGKLSPINPLAALPGNVKSAVSGGDNLVDKLSSLDVKGFADNFVMAVGQMPQEKQQSVLTTIFEMLGFNGSTKGQSLADDEDGEEYEDEDGEEGFDDEEEEEQNNENATG